MSRRDNIVYELNQLVEQHNGSVLPQQVVEFAIDETTELHSYFEWDENEAAAKYRLHQARTLLRVHVRLILPNGDPENVRAFVSLTDDRRNRNGYRPMVSVLEDEELRRALVIDAIGELRVFERKYKALNELSAVFEAVHIVETEQQTQAESSGAESSTAVKQSLST